MMKCISDNIELC